MRKQFQFINNGFGFHSHFIKTQFMLPKKVVRENLLVASKVNLTLVAIKLKLLVTRKIEIIIKNNLQNIN